MKTPTIEEIDAALAELNRAHITGLHVEDLSVSCVSTIRFLAKLAKVVMGEPTAAMMMHDATCKHHDPFDMSCVARANRMRIWKAMIEVAIKGAQDE